MTDPSLFVPENANPEGRTEHLSSSGQYKLVVTPYRTKQGCWNYSQGLVFKLGQDQPIAEIRRNYGCFPFLFIENHPNGHPYFVGGQDYQGQTVIELDTGARRDFLPEGAEDGVGFCWSDYRFDPKSMLLTVDGCIWACPYEYRFYDFSNPMQGWPQLDFEGAYADGQWPEISDDGLIRCFEPEPHKDDEEDAEELPVEERGWAVIRRFRRHGNELRFVSIWLSEAEGQRRVQRAQSERAYEQWRQEFTTQDPLYLEMRQQLKDPAFSPADYEACGITYEGWCPGWSGEERRWSRRIIEQTNGFTVDLDWGVKAGPVKLSIFLAQKTHDTRFFEHSVEGMREALAYAKSLVNPTPLQKLLRVWKGGES